MKVVQFSVIAFDWMDIVHYNLYDDGKCSNAHLLKHQWCSHHRITLSGALGESAHTAALVVRPMFPRALCPGPEAKR